MLAQGERGIPDVRWECDIYQTRSFTRETCVIETLLG
jgi:hypothetical protein